ncbi:hypothetical protein EVAR_56076_1 [Eumeta japonica]|uniref:Uncharacterized protein n=1 Tax=Eumeta variegata TaxID=151549 RepID=A0A4C1YML1_EUMVA|nr:hypothetical protein EVAR_56076_1 [Eumeta japonica]
MTDLIYLRDKKSSRHYANHRSVCGRCDLPEEAEKKNLMLKRNSRWKNQLKVPAGSLTVQTSDTVASANRLMMEPEGGHRNSVIKRRNPSSLGSFDSSSTLILYGNQGLMMELEGGHRNSVIKRRNPIEFGLV